MDISTRPGLRLVVGGSATEPDHDDLWQTGESDSDASGEYAWDEPVWLYPFVPGRPLEENCYSMARPLFGKPRADWARCLAGDLVARRPEAGQGKQKRGWAAGVLLAAAIDHGWCVDPCRWLEVMHDVTELSGVRRETAIRRLRQLGCEGLTRPVNPPPFWVGIEPICRVEDDLDLGGQ